MTQISDFIDTVEGVHDPAPLLDPAALEPIFADSISITGAQDYANEAFGNAIAHISSLTAIGEVLAEFPTFDVDLTPLTASIDAFQQPDLPQPPPGLDMNLPDAPNAPQLGSVDGVNVGEAPVFDAVLPATNLAITPPSALTLTLPEVPSLTDALLPTAPTLGALANVATITPGDAPAFDVTRPAINLDLAAPPALTATLPTAPSLNALVLPNAPPDLVLGSVDALVVEDAPVFNVNAPTINLDIAPPAALDASLPSAPVLADVLMPDAPEGLLVGAVTPLVTSDAPVFSDVAPQLDLNIARPLGLTPVLPDVPVVRDLDVPAAPDAPTLTDVGLLSLGVAPEFSAVAPAINLDIPVPVESLATLPVRPDVLDVAIPTAADPLLPDVPSLQAIEVPSPPELNLPNFDAVLGNAPSVPAIGFAWTEAPYQSGLLDTLRNTLQAWVDGASTGLSPAVEAALWNRGRDREQASALQATDTLLSTFAVRGFARPPGAAAVALQRAAQLLNDTNVTSSREIAVQQAQLEQGNRHFAMTTALGVETQLMQYVGQVATRALDAAKFAASVGLDIFRAEVQAYQADIQAFGVRAEVFKAVLQAELAKLDVFRARIEAQKLIGEVNQQLVALYSARVNAATTLIEMFRARIQGAQAAAEVQRTKIQAYAAEVGAYGESVRANASRFDAYATQVKAEVSKVETFKVQADAYTSQVQGFAALVNARKVEKDAEIEIRQRLPLDLFKARTEGFRNSVEALKAASEVDRTRIQGYSAQVGALGELTRARALDVDIYKASIDAERSKADTYRIQVEAYGKRIDAFVAQTNAEIAVKNQEIKLNTEVPIEISKARIAVFEAMVRAASAVAEAQRTKVQAYSAQVEAFGKQVQAKSGEVEVFKAEIDAQRGKADVYRIQTDAYGRQVDAYKAINEARIAAKNSEIKVSAELPIEVSKAQIALYEANVRATSALSEVDRTRVQAYQAQVGAFGEQVRARSTDIEAYKVTVDAEKSKADIYRIDTEAYKARVEAFDVLVKALVAAKDSEITVNQRLPLELLKTQVEAYRASLAGADTVVKQQGQRIDLYRAELDGVQRSIQAQGVAVDTYKALIDGERAKVDVYKVQAQAYGETVNGWRARVEALVAAKNIEVKIGQELPLEVYKAQAQGYDTLVKAESERVKALGSVYETGAHVYEAEVKGETARVGAQVDVFKAEADSNSRSNELRLKAVEVELDRAKVQVSLLVEALKTGAQTAAQLGSAALSQINISTGFHTNVSNNQSRSVSASSTRSDDWSTRVSWNNNYNHSD